ARARFVGKIADDEFGRMVLRGLADCGVETSRVVVTRDGTSPFSLVAIDATDASRTIFHSAGGDALDLAPEEVDWTCLDGARVLLVDGHQLRVQREAAERARAAGIAVL